MPCTKVSATRTTGKPGTSKDVLFMLGGLALISGILARNKYLGYGGLCMVASASLPDLKHYIKISTM